MRYTKWNTFLRGYTSIEYLLKSKVMRIVILTFSLLLVVYGCSKDNEGQIIIEKEGYIMGFDPCTIHHHYKIGYVFVTEDLSDTLLTYNLSDEMYKMPPSVLLRSSDTLYKIPELYFENYRNSPFFSDSLRYKYPIKISYSIARDDEMIFNLCTTDIISIIAPQIIIKSATKQ